MRGLLAVWSGMILAVAGGAAEPVSAAAWQRFHARSVETLRAFSAATVPAAPMPADVAELGFEEIFLPVGDGGLEYTPRVRALAGSRVRMSGFMVREAGRQRGFFLLAARPGALQPAGGCVAADIPLNAVHVHLAGGAASAPVPFRPGRVVVTGVLEIGPRPEADGRNSTLRLRVVHAGEDLTWGVTPTGSLPPP